MVTNPHESLVNATSTALSAISGVLLSHPLDRASFLAAKHKRSFFIAENFHNPYQGFMQAATHKALIGSPMYFFLMDEMTHLFKPYLQEDPNNVIKRTALVAFGVGASHGLISTPALAVKSYTWSHSNPHAYWIQNAHAMFKLAGIKPFIRCAPAIVARDAVNAVVYEYVRLTLHDSNITAFKSSFICNTVGAICSVSLSSIFNYIRQNQLAVLPECEAPSSRELVTQLWNESKTFQTSIERAGFIAKRLQLTVSLVRFAILIPIFQETYLQCQKILNDEIKSAECLTNRP